jgi:hypothetical protein
MISDKNKRKIKEIKLLKENNWQKKYQTFTTYFKEFRRPYSNQNPIKKKISYNPKNDNFFYFRLRNKNSFIHKNDNRNKYLDSFNPYVTMMMTNATNLTHYNHTEYVVKNNNTDFDRNITEYNKSKKKKYFGLEGKTPLYDNDLYETNTENFKMSSINDLYMKTTMGIGMKTMSDLNNKEEKNKTINTNNNERHYTFADDEMATTIFFDNNLKKEERVCDKEDRNKFYRDYFIQKKLTFDEFNDIEKNLRRKQDIKVRNIEKRDYRDPFKSKKVLKINSQMTDTVEKIRLDLQFQKFQKEYEDVCKFNIKNNRMPNIKIMSKHIHQIEEETNNTKQIKSKKKSIYEKEFLFLNLKDYLNNKMKESFINGNNKYVRYEQNPEEFKLDIGLIKIRHHPILRTFSAISYDELRGLIYLYGGLGGKIFGDIWVCKFKYDIKKIVWEKIYTPPNTIGFEEFKGPFPRYGHSMHFINNKLYVVGGEFDDWKKDYYKKDILWIYDIDKNEWELNENKSTFQNNQEELQTNKNKSKNESRVNLKNINQNNIKKDEKRNKIISNAKINKFKDNPRTLSSKNFLKKNKIIGKEERKVGFLNKKIRIKTVNINSVKTRKKGIELKNKDDNNEEINNNNIEDDEMNKLLYPCLRKNHASLFLGSSIFIYGGIDSNNNFLNDCWIYDLNKRKWDLLDFRGRYPPPLGFHSCCMALEKDQLNSPFLSIYNKPASNRKTLPLLKLEGIFFFGGINETKIPTNLLFQLTIGFKPATFEIPPTNGKPPSPRMCASMNFSPECNMIFIHGGKNDFLDDVHLNDIVMLDLETLDWIHPATNNLIPPSRAQHFSIVIGNQIVIFGGSNAESLLNFDFMMINVDI